MQMRDLKKKMEFDLTDIYWLTTSLHTKIFINTK